VKFKLADICNKDEAFSFIPENGKPSFNPHSVHAFVLHDHGYVVTVVFASHLQDALDEAVDQNQLDQFQITDVDAPDYPTLNTEEEEGITRLGNASEPFDIEGLDVIEMTNESFFSQLLNVEFDTDANV
jgi:hypothetical protein